MDSRHSAISSDRVLPPILAANLDLTGRVVVHGNMSTSIGFGGSSDILPATLDGQNVAAKLIRTAPSSGHSSGEELIMQRMHSEREILIWDNLRHPNILPLLGYSNHEGRLALISPWVGEGTIADYLDGHPRAHRLPLIADFTDGLAYMHSVGVVHGDMKCANALVDTASGSPHVLLCDFGLSRVVDGQHEWLNACGTTAFMAPELHLIPSFNLDEFTGETTFASDVWSWAMAVYEIYTGRPPFAELHLPDRALARHIALGGLPDLENPSYACNQALPSELRDILVSCWDHDPTKRPSMYEIQQRMKLIMLRYPIHHSHSIWRKVVDKVKKVFARFREA